MLKITVRDKTFTINLVNNYAHQVYDEIAKKSRELASLAEKLQQDFAEYSKADKTAEVKKDYAAKLRDFEISKDVIKDDLIEFRNNFIKEILETNGLEFDVSWWLHNTGPEDLNDFMLKCINKDLNIEGKKSNVKK